MNLFDSLNSACEITKDITAEREDQQLQQMYPDPTQWAESYQAFKTAPSLFPNMATLICSPYPEDNWGDINGIVSTFDEECRLPRQDDRIDPNKIYTSDIAALRALAADQIRVTKLFEKKLTESLKEKDKFGLNEADIMAMQALTAARSAVTAINKEQIQIKKNIADIRLKQQQNKYSGASGGNGGMDTSMPGYATSAQIGRQIMDDIFNMPGNVVDTSIPYEPQSSNDLDMASRVLDDIVGSGNGVIYETMNPTTYAVMDQYGNHIGFETHDGNGNLIEEYDNPTSRIKEFDRDAMQAIDEMERPFPVIIK